MASHVVVRVGDLGGHGGSGGRALVETDSADAAAWRAGVRRQLPRVDGDAIYTCGAPSICQCWSHRVRAASGGHLASLHKCPMRPRRRSV